MIKQLLLLIVFFLLSGSFFYAQTDTTLVGAPGTGPGGINPDFSTLKEACDYLNSKTWEPGVSAEYVIITSNLTEPSGVVLTAFNRAPGSVLISFFPMDDKNPVITFTDAGDTSDTEYGWYIESFDIDIAELTIQSDGTSSKNIIPLKIKSTEDDPEMDYGIYVRYSNIYYRSQTLNANPSLPCWAIIVEGFRWGLITNTISACFNGVSPYSGAILAYGGGGGIALNTIEARKTGIDYYSAGESYIYGNQITLNQDKAYTEIYGIKVGYFENMEIEANQIVLSKNNYSTAVSMYGVYATDAVTVRNNMISGFNACKNAVDSKSEFIGIKMGAVNTYLSFNTIKMEDLPVLYTGNSNPLYAGIDIGNDFYGALYNNIVINEEDDIPAYCLFSRTNILVSDYNNLHTGGDSAYTGNLPGIAAKTLNDWQMLSGQDSNSVSVEVFFAAPNDLHLAGSSVGDNNLAGTRYSLDLYLDIDGMPRYGDYPYMGADEADVPLTERVISSVADKFLPQKYELLQNYPNPFNPVTKIVFNLPGDSHVKLEVIGITGEVIKILLDEYKTAGSYTSYFTADNLASGTYIYRLTAGKEVVSRKMMLLK